MGAYTIAHNAQNGQAQDASKDCGWSAYMTDVRICPHWTGTECDGDLPIEDGTTE